MALFRKKDRRGEDGAVDPDDRSPKTGLKYKDLSVLGSLMNHGADLSQPRHVLHFLYFPSEQAAATAGRAAEKQGFTSTVTAPLPEHPGQWSLVAEQHDLVIDLDTVRHHGDFFDELAALHEGEYDGWEASV